VQRSFKLYFQTLRDTATPPYAMAAGAGRS
jgi:hypothetical protein